MLVGVWGDGYLPSSYRVLTPDRPPYRTPLHMLGIALLSHYLYSPALPPLWRADACLTNPTNWPDQLPTSRAYYQVELTIVNDINDLARSTYLT